MDNPLEAFAGGITGLFIGSPKSGKSTLLGSICELVPPEQVVLICPKPNEVNSHLYVRHGLNKEAHVFHDLRWRPAVGMYEADGYRQLMQFLVELYDRDDVRAVLLDPLTDAVQLAAHELLKAEQAATPRDLRDSISFYGALRYRLRDLVQTLTTLASPALSVPKHVFVAVHAQPTKEEDIKKNPTAEGKAKGVSYFGDVLPTIEGSYRQDIAGEFDMVGFTTIRHRSEQVRPGKFERKTNYLVQLRPDSERHAGVRLAPALEEKEFPNSLPVILQAVVDSLRKAA